MTQERMSAAEARAQLAPTAKPSKYRNTPVTVDGIRFDSKAEAKRYHQLKLLERGGSIYNLRRQVWHELQAANGAVACRYRSDFDYNDTSTGNPITEDVKGVLTRDFKIKARLFKEQYGREIRVIKS